MSTSTVTPATTGTWVIDPSHSNVEFVVKHLVVAKVGGRFGSFSGTIDIADPIERSTVDVTLDAASIESGGVRVSDTAKIEFDVQLAKQA